MTSSCFCCGGDNPSVKKKDSQTNTESDFRCLRQNINDRTLMTLSLDETQRALPIQERCL